MSRSRRQRRWTTWRRVVQAAVAAAFLALPLVAAALGGDALSGRALGTLAAFSVGPVEVVEPAGALSAVLASGALGAGLLLAVLPWIAVALALGPVFCSWVCPFGLASELLDRAAHRGPRLTWRPERFRRLRWPRVAVFAALMLLALLAAVPLAALLSPPRLMTVLPVEAALLGVVSPVTGGLLAGLLAFEVAGTLPSSGTGRRLWCRALCPVGTGFKLLRGRSKAGGTLTVAWHEPTCSCPGVPACQTVCAWGIDPRRMGTYDGCTNCFACVEACPTGSLAPTFGPPGDRRRGVAGDDLGRTASERSAKGVAA